MMRMKEAHDKKLTRLDQELQRMKQQEAHLKKRLKDEADRHAQTIALRGKVCAYPMVMVSSMSF